MPSPAGTGDPADGVANALRHPIERRAVDRPTSITTCYDAICEAFGHRPPERPSEAAVHPLPAPVVPLARYGFIGREPELGEIERAWQRSVSGRATHVLIEGEAGIGKTSLAREVAHRLHVEGALVLHGRCFERMPLPHQPFALALTEYLRHLPPDGHAAG